MCVYIYISCVYTHCPQASLWAKRLPSFSLFLLPYDEFVLKGIFFMNKGLDASSFPCEMAGVVPWGKLHSERQSGCDPLRVYASQSLLYTLTRADHVCNCVGCLMKFGWCHPWPAEAKACLLLSFSLSSAWAREQQNQNGWTDFLCSVNKTWLFCCVFDVGVEGFSKVKLRGSRQSDFFVCLFV